MKPRLFSIIEHCVEAGAQRGYHRAHKHDAVPTPETIAEAITHAVMGELCEWFEFDEPL